MVIFSFLVSLRATVRKRQIPKRQDRQCGIRIHLLPSERPRHFARIFNRDESPNQRHSERRVGSRKHFERGSALSLPGYHHQNAILALKYHSRFLFHRLPSKIFGKTLRPYLNWAPRDLHRFARQISPARNIQVYLAS